MIGNEPCPICGETFLDHSIKQLDCCHKVAQIKDFVQRRGRTRPKTGDLT